MHRRDVLSLLGATVLTPLLMPLSAEERWTVGEHLHRRLLDHQGQGRVLTADQMALVTSLADTILPRTDTPGAVEVGTPAFVDLLLAEWYSDQDKGDLLTGLDGFDARCRAATGKGFAELTPLRRGGFLATIDSASAEKGPVEAAYRKLKDAIVFGYLTSKPVATMLATMPIIPGRFDGCTPVGGAQ